MKTPLSGRKKYTKYTRSWFSFMGNPFAPGIATHFVKNKYDLIQLHQIWFLPSLFATLFSKGTKKVVIIHGVYPDKATFFQKFFINLYKPFAQYVINNSEAVMVQSNSEKEKLLKHFRVHKNKILVIYNGITLENNRKKIKNEENTILFTGRTIPDKNPDLVIKAGKILSDKNLKFKIKFIGTIEENYKEELLQLANNLGIKDKIIFIPNIPKERRADLMKEYASAFTCVAVGSWEGLPNRLMEAMQFGVPCIAYASGGTPELIQDKKTGLLIKDLDERELAKKIELLMKNKKLYESIGKNGKKMVETKFNWDNTFEKIWGTYQV
jgi:glycosyltransferase involved in cell wall biosynthesis